MTILKEICLKKEAHIKHQKSLYSLSDLDAQIKDAEPPRGFLKALKKTPPSFICEIKKASPSKGLIRDDFNPEKHARDYEEAGATCLSVLTDIPYFQGHDNFLIQAKKSCSIPVLRKDFMIDPYQIYESRALGADCILIIMACLTDTQAHELYQTSKDLGMDSLIEVHDDEELTRADKLSPEMIGVNNRNLKNMHVSLDTSKKLFAKMAKNTFKICESGIHMSAQVDDMLTHGAQGFLIGESLMKQKNIQTAFKELTKNIQK